MKLNKRLKKEKAILLMHIENKKKKNKRGVL